MLTRIAKRSRFLTALYGWLLQFGFNPRTFGRAIKNFPLYVKDMYRFRRQCADVVRWRPELHDREESAGAVHSEYFWQDLYVARRICDASPTRHIDVGSRIDGFVAHVASFRQIEVLDIRPISVPIPNVQFRQADLMRLPPELDGVVPSVSCLHALEHFGLGRYGDPLSGEGYIQGFASLARMLAPGGVLYLSCPVGLPRVEFNSHRVISPQLLAEQARERGLSLTELAVFDPAGAMNPWDTSMESLGSLGGFDYSLAVFVFTKNPEAN